MVNAILNSVFFLAFLCLDGLAIRYGIEGKTGEAIAALTGGSFCGILWLAWIIKHLNEEATLRLWQRIGPK